jgi:hypothetical protein
MSHGILPEKTARRQPLFWSTQRRQIFVKKLYVMQNRGPGALERSRVSCDPERIEVLLELNGPTVADRPHVSDLCFAFFSLPVKPEVIVAESHDFLAAVGLKDFVRVKDEFVETRRQAFENA